MTSEKLQAFARVLGNNTWCRYWLNYLCTRCPVIMAIQCRDENGKPHPVPDLIKHGFREESDFIYTIQRTEEDGTPYESCIF